MEHSHLLQRQYEHLRCLIADQAHRSGSSDDADAEADAGVAAIAIRAPSQSVLRRLASPAQAVKGQSGGRHSSDRQHRHSNKAPRKKSTVNPPSALAAAPAPAAAPSAAVAATKAQLLTPAVGTPQLSGTATPARGADSTLRKAKVNDSQGLKLLADALQQMNLGGGGGGGQVAAPPAPAPAPAASRFAVTPSQPAPAPTNQSVASAAQNGFSSPPAVAVNGQQQSVPVAVAQSSRNQSPSGMHAAAAVPTCVPVATGPAAGPPAGPTVPVPAPAPLPMQMPAGFAPAPNQFMAAAGMPGMPMVPGINGMPMNDLFQMFVQYMQHQPQPVGGFGLPAGQQLPPGFPQQTLPFGAQQLPNCGAVPQQPQANAELPNPRQQP